ncbi:hypothetical protein T484DRAFT_3263566 [Baffinella frigidus]|nr:hypothetical protein T484DRAFT_3263566 [Cryptophyta sp. CCMP2293]
MWALKLSCAPGSRCLDGRDVGCGGCGWRRRVGFRGRHRHQPQHAQRSWAKGRALSRGRRQRHEQRIALARQQPRVGVAGGRGGGRAVRLLSRAPQRRGRGRGHLPRPAPAPSQRCREPAPAVRLNEHVPRAGRRGGPGDGGARRVGCLSSGGVATGRPLLPRGAKPLDSPSRERAGHLQRPDAGGPFPLRPAPPAAGAGPRPLADPRVARDTGVPRAGLRRLQVRGAALIELRDTRRRRRSQPHGRGADDDVSCAPCRRRPARAWARASCRRRGGAARAGHVGGRQPGGGPPGVRGEFGGCRG